MEETSSPPPLEKLKPRLHSSVPAWSNLQPSLPWPMVDSSRPLSRRCHQLDGVISVVQPACR